MLKFKNAIRQKFSGVVNFRNRLYNDWKHAKFKGLPIQDVFQTIFKEHHWRGVESVSGTGSDVLQTEEVKKIILSVIHKYKIGSIVDVPCGDLNWVKDINLENLHYCGIDIVEELIAINRKKFAGNNRSFLCGDLTSSSLPKADLVLCRDCFVHFSYRDTEKALGNIISSGSEYLLTTTFCNHKNRNIVTGNWRPIDLMSAPYHFPSPVQLFNEKCTEDSRYADKSLGLWRIEDLLQRAIC